MDKKVKIIILVLSMLVVGLITFIVVDKVTSNKEQKSSNTEVSTNQTSSQTINNTNENKVDENKDDEKKEDRESKESVAISEVRKALKDKNWLKKNIYVQDDEGAADGDVGEQEISFIVCKNSDKPIVVVQVLAEDVRFAKVILVSYSDGKVTAEKINQGHIYHGAYSVDANKCAVRSIYMYGGTDGMIYHNIASGKVKFIGAYSREAMGDDFSYFIKEKSMYDEGKTVSKQEYEEYKSNLNESQYNFVDIGTELTNENVDKYIK